MAVSHQKDLEVYREYLNRLTKEGKVKKTTAEQKLSAVRNWLKELESKGIKDYQKGLILNPPKYKAYAVKEFLSVVGKENQPKKTTEKEKKAKVLVPSALFPEELEEVVVPAFEEKEETPLRKFLNKVAKVQLVGSSATFPAEVVSIINDKYVELLRLDSQEEEFKGRKRFFERETSKPNRILVSLENVVLYFKDELFV